MFSSLRLALPALVLVAGLGLPKGADAAPNITRKGGQWGVTLGGSACIPGKAKCIRDNVQEGGVTVDGKTRPSFGMAGELGYRFNKFVFAGAHYNLGFFDTNYEVTGMGGYKHAYQNSIYGVVRGIIPAWRFDFGLAAGPGFSRQTFKMDNGDKDYSQGFSWIISPSIDIWVARRVFLGAKLDLLFNGHRKTCHERGSRTDCVKGAANTDVAPVHQMIFGLHIGGTFL